MTKVTNKFLKKFIDQRQQPADRFEQFAASVEAVDGWLPIYQARWLFEHACSVPEGGRILEIGSYKGRSTTALAFGCVNTRKHVFAVDRWQGTYIDIQNQTDLLPTFNKGFFDDWQHAIQTNNLQAYVTPFVGDSTEVAKFWRAPIDMLFIDATHQYEDVIRDFENFFPYVSMGGLVAFHDVVEEWDGVWRAWRDVISRRLSRPDNYIGIGFGYKA